MQKTNQIKIVRSPNNTTSIYDAQLPAAGAQMGKRPGVHVNSQTAKVHFEPWFPAKSLPHP